MISELRGKAFLAHLWTFGPVQKASNCRGSAPAWGQQAAAKYWGANIAISGVTGIFRGSFSAVLRTLRHTNVPIGRTPKLT
jgi:hypothetical protein